MVELRADGPVEREARQLVEAAARWLSAVPDDGEYVERTVDQEAAAEASAGPESAEHGSAEQGSAGHGSAGGPESAGEQEHLCTGCPWCRAKAAVGPLGADTLDSVAHLLSAAAESLSLFAQSRREAARPPEECTAGDADHDASTDTAGAGADLRDAIIDWEDEDEDAGEDQGGPGTTAPGRTQERPTG